MSTCAQCGRTGLPYDLCFACELIARGWADFAARGWAVFASEDPVVRANRIHEETGVIIAVSDSRG